jgi:hypothetical protein
LNEKRKNRKRNKKLKKSSSLEWSR